MVSPDLAWTIVISMSASYWLGNLVKSLVIVHNDKAGIIRWLQGYRSDLEIATVIFMINLIFTWGVGLFGHGLVYPFIESTFSFGGRIVIAISAGFFNFSTVLNYQSDSRGNWVLGVRLLSALFLLSSFYYIPEIKFAVETFSRNRILENSTVNQTSNKSV